MRNAVAISYSEFLAGRRRRASTPAHSATWCCAVARVTSRSRSGASTAAFSTASASPAGPASPPATDVARIPLEITPGFRCDEHARGQATAPFDFLMRLRIGDGAAIAYAIELPLAAMEAATEALDVACLARAEPRRP